MAAQLVASRAVLSSTELVSQLQQVVHIATTGFYSVNVEQYMGLYLQRIEQTICRPVTINSD
jgi:hypothetical protein